jgi:hypothetical protein
MYDPLVEAGGTDERLQLTGWQIPVSVAGKEGCDPQCPGQCFTDRSIGGLAGARARITAGERRSSTEPKNPCA